MEIHESVAEQLGVLPFDSSLIKNRLQVLAHAKFLSNNLDRTFDDVVASNVSNQTQIIPNVPIQVSVTVAVKVTMALYSNNFLGNYTAFCPELEGCITEAGSKKEALVRLCSAISSVLVLNYDVLGIQCVTPAAREPKPSAGAFLDGIHEPAQVAFRLRLNHHFSSLYLSPTHILVKRPDLPRLTLTISNYGIHAVTFDMLEGVAGRYPRPHQWP